MGTFRINPRYLAYGITAAGILLSASLLFSFLHTRDLAIDVLDIGQGDSIFITTPTGERILVDGGPNATVIAKLSKRLGFFDHTIDLVIATHPQADHITGLLSVLDRFTVKRIMLTAITNETPEYRALREKIAEKHIPILDTAEVPAITISDASPVTLDVLWPRRSYSGKLVDDPNIVSTIFKLTYREKQFLFTGDAIAAMEQELLRQEISVRADVLKVGHHGSDTSTTQEFLDAVDPSIAVISVGRNNHFGHPSPRVLRRLERKGADIYRTDLEGDIHITSDGKTNRVFPQRR